VADDGIRALSDRVLFKAAFLCSGPGVYDRRSEGAAIEPFAKSFHLASLLERANLRYRSGHIPRHGNPAVVSDAKARLCRFLQVPHLSIWEDREKPDGGAVKAVLEAALRAG
jgi:hypothetical protein